MKTIGSLIFITNIAAATNALALPRTEPDNDIEARASPSTDGRSYVVCLAALAEATAIGPECAELGHPPDPSTALGCISTVGETVYDLHGGCKPCTSAISKNKKKLRTPKKDPKKHDPKKQDPKKHDPKKEPEKEEPKKTCKREPEGGKGGKGGKHC